MEIAAQKTGTDARESYLASWVQLQSINLEKSDRDRYAEIRSRSHTARH
jgi:hypothetical protein